VSAATSRLRWESSDPERSAQHRLHGSHRSLTGKIALIARGTCTFSAKDPQCPERRRFRSARGEQRPGRPVAMASDEPVLKPSCRPTCLAERRTAEEL